jgi:hypothetical protein
MIAWGGDDGIAGVNVSGAVQENLRAIVHVNPEQIKRAVALGPNSLLKTWQARHFEKAPVRRWLKSLSGQCDTR